MLLSSPSVYGRTEHVIVDEATPLRAIGTYGASKIAGECAARAYAAEHGVEVVILRPCWVCGPRRRTACMIRTMIDNALQGRPTRLGYGRGFPRQFVHVDDVAEAVLSSISAPAAVGHAINLSDGSWRTLDEVAGLVGAVQPAARILLADVPAPTTSFSARFRSPVRPCRLIGSLEPISRQASAPINNIFRLTLPRACALPHSWPNHQSPVTKPNRHAQYFGEALRAFPASGQGGTRRADPQSGVGGGVSRSRPARGGRCRSPVFYALNYR
ncbi:NAD(P)-dependent oxidoreductase [Ancylobacter defluvii]|nr:NAD(P)-dependent oxidoreductase [Ancylobacter defluvii]